MTAPRILAIAVLVLAAPLAARAQDDCQTLLPKGLNFPTVSSTPPYDAVLTPNPPPGDVQKSFDLFSWASFVALNWPGNPDGTPMPGPITDYPTAPRVWERYIGASQVFKPDGGADTWGGGNSLFAEVVPGYRPGQKVLFATTKTTSVNAVELADIAQAGFNMNKLPPIADLNKKYVFYEIHLNKVEYGYLMAKALYNQNGQSAFLQSATPPPAISFPMGTLGDPSANPPVKAIYGATEVKAAWKVLGPGDDPKKFYAIKATMIDPVTAQPVPDVPFGLVGLHIITRTVPAPQWIWATFEHVDNAPDVGETKLAPHYNFNDPNAGQPAAGFVNKPQDPRPIADPTPTQITRVLNNNNINSAWTKCLNATMQAELKGTVWANYRLVTTQWPTANSATGRPFIPAKLSNTTMETYFQQSVSCMDCHAAALMAVKTAGGQPASANFSYLLQAANPVATPAAKAEAKTRIEGRRAAAREK